MDQLGTACGGKRKGALDIMSPTRVQ